MGSVDGRVVLITGAGEGIGRASARLAAREGAKVVVTDRSDSSGIETVRLILEEGGEATFTSCDVTSPEQVEAAVRFTVETYGRLDGAINNAGISGSFTPFTELSGTEWANVISVDLTGVFHCVQAEVNEMLKTGGGSIVNISSNAGLSGASTAEAYCAAKHGVIGLTQSVALDYAAAGIRVNAICPGITMTPMVAAAPPGVLEAHAGLVPLGRNAQPEEIAEPILFLLSDKASFITGQALAVDGGMITGALGFPKRAHA